MGRLLGRQAAGVAERHCHQSGASRVVGQQVRICPDHSAHRPSREVHGVRPGDCARFCLLRLAEPEHRAIAMHPTDHVSVQDEGKPAEHPALRDPGNALQVVPHHVGRAFIIRHAFRPLLSAAVGQTITPAMSQPTFVLVRPQMGENIGAAARGMWNFGLDRMVVVAPRDGWPNPRAAATASGAGRLLDDARLAADTAEAVAEAAFVFATTARPRDLTKPVFTPEAAMRKAAGLTAAGNRVAVMFGPERAGLENEDIARANATISVPVNPDFPSLNLAQCVLLCAYEWRRATTAAVAQGMEFAGTAFANSGEVEALARHYEERLDEAGFFFPPEKAPGMKITLRNLWSRMPLTRADAQILHGILRQMVRWAGRVD